MRECMYISESAHTLHVLNDRQPITQCAFSTLRLKQRLRDTRWSSGCVVGCLVRGPCLKPRPGQKCDLIFLLHARPWVALEGRLGNKNGMGQEKLDAIEDWKKRIKC